MMDSLINVITSALRTVPAELVIFIISMLPVLELRGGLIAASLLRVNWCAAFPICVLGNMLPVPFVLLFIDKIFAFLKKAKFHKIAEFFEQKAHKKSKALEKYKEWGLFGFVAVPLPGTGAWTGALIAALLRLNIKRSSFIITLGVIAAGLIMSLLSYVLPGLFV